LFQRFQCSIGAFLPRFESAGCPLSFFRKKYYLKS